jgi:hypothetical protein
MGNGVLAVVKKVEGAAVEVGEGVVHVVEVIGHGAVSAEKILTDAQKMTPAFKAGITKLIQDGEALSTAFVAVGSNPANLIADIAAVATLKTFVTDFVAFLPVLKADGSALIADTK